GARVINDDYNANATSTRAALAALALLAAERRTAVLGAMAELGAASAAVHRAIADEARAAGIRVVTVAAPEYGVVGPDAVEDVAAAIERLGPLDEHDAVLVKGSRIAGLELLADRLLEP
ncbi:MAG: UDP-N-acetylmuramoylalanyl-D-glutamyl-2,6-diaminopimelate--D-alanyl-D-alanine ligase, partial [Acidimicrobiales bacterium]|nr:UDP-N-acetylmuramoylalanyl-D-glutamyl-2,6-diaminopimelate--D-alanyl-D-alanine ligase [Acidimicrobiales bacterium]